MTSLCLLLALLLQDRFGSADLRHSERPTCVLFHPDGKTLISGALDGTLRVWSVETGKAVRIIETEDVQPLALAISPDGTLVAAAGGGNVVGVWEIASGKRILMLKRHEAQALAVAFSPDGKLLATGGMDGTVRTFDLASGRELHSLVVHKRGVTSVAFLDAASIATCGYDTRVKIVSGDRAIREWEAHPDLPCVLAASGSTIATSSWDGTTRLWDSTGKELAKFESRANALAFRGAQVVVAGHDQQVRLWDGKESRTIAKVYALSCAVSPDGKLLAATDLSRAVRLWDIESGRERHVREGHRGAVRSLAFVDGRLFSAGSEGEIRQWENGTSKRIHERGVMLIALDRGYAFVDEGVHVVRDGAVRTLDRKGIMSLAASGDRLALAGTGGVEVWDLSTGETRRMNRKLSTAAAFVGDRLVVAHSDGTIEDRPIHVCTIDSMTLSPDGRVLASIGEDGYVRFVRAEDLRQEFYVVAGKRPAALAFSPDGSLFAVGNAKGSIVLRETDSGAPVREPWVHSGGVTALTFSPDGRHLYSGGSDSTILRWDLGRAEPGVECEALFGEDASKAYQAMRSLAAAGDRAIPALERALEDRTDAWLADLDHDEPAVRERAAARLEGLEIAPKLEAMLERGPELKARAEELLARLKKGGAPGRGELGRLRAVRVLAALGVKRKGGLSARERALAAWLGRD